jgi:hypothetical protein
MPTPIAIPKGIPSRVHRADADNRRRPSKARVPPDQPFQSGGVHQKPHISLEGLVPARA